MRKVRLDNKGVGIMTARVNQHNRPSWQNWENHGWWPWLSKVTGRDRDILEAAIIAAHPQAPKRTRVIASGKLVFVTLNGAGYAIDSAHD